MTQDSKYSVVFEDPRLKMTFVGRMFVRISVKVAFALLFVLSFTLLTSDMRSMRWLGVFTILFIADRIIHYGEPDKPLRELPTSGRVNLAYYTHPRAFRSIENAFERALIKGESFYLAVLDEVLKNRHSREVLARLDVSPKEFIEKIQSSLKEDAVPTREIIVERTQDLMQRAFIKAVSDKGEFIDQLDIFAALGGIEDRKLQHILNIFSLDPKDFERGSVYAGIVKRMPFWKRTPSSLTSLALTGRTKTRHRVVNRAWTSRATPTLDRYGTDFTDFARQSHLGFMIGHAKEYNRLIETTSRSINPNALLVGELGSGKETIIAHLAANLVQDTVPPGLFDRRLVSLDLSMLVASATPDELQSRLRKVAEEIQMAGNIILFVPDIHNLVKTSGTAYLSAADALLPIIMNNSFPVIGTTYPKEFKQVIETRSDFIGLFDPINVEEITESEAEKVLMYEALILEKQSKVKISLGAIESSVAIAKKHFRSKLLPSSAEELLKAAVVTASQNGDKILTKDGVIRVAEQKTNVPLREAGEEEAKRLLNMENIIHERLVDQEEAVKAVSGALREYRSGLSRKGGPISSFLFVGPTGVGKTELAKILASLQFGSDKAMIRFDMTEYQDKQSFFRFIGSPDQTISGALTDAVREKPYSLILLDEFEKAYPDILNLFLQVLDDGRLTDNQGRVIDFQNTIIIATSNAHSNFITESLSSGVKMQDIADQMKKKLIDVFRPELVNRFSKVIVFKNLEPHELITIAKMNLKSLSELVSEQGIELGFEDAVVNRIAELGYDPAFGARPLRRVIDERIKSPLSEAILKREIGAGSKIEAFMDGSEIRFRQVV